MSDFKGLVLTNTPVKEADVILNVLSDHGKVSLKARGVLKANAKNRSVTEVGCYSMFHTLEQLSTKILVLKNAETVERFPNISKDLLKKTIYGCLLEAFNKSEPALEKALHYVYLLEKSENPYCLYALFLAHCLQEQGIELVADECVCCHATSKLCGISLREGGFVCENCFSRENGKYFPSRQLRNVRYLMHARLENYDVLEKNTTVDYETVEIIYLFLQNYGEFSIRSHRFLEVLQPLV